MSAIDLASGSHTPDCRDDWKMEMGGSFAVVNYKSVLPRWCQSVSWDKDSAE